jgi:hypothetical protein
MLYDLLTVEEKALRDTLAQKLCDTNNAIHDLRLVVEAFQRTQFLAKFSRDDAKLFQSLYLPHVEAYENAIKARDESREKFEAFDHSMFEKYGVKS